MTLPTTDPDHAARVDLARHRGFATGLLALMAVLTVASFLLPRSYAAELLGAAARAGLVGGLADWFAVTALFRRPLGLPIPHTAIIPSQKARLGAALGRFVANHVFTEADVARLLGRIDLPGLLRSLFADPAVAGPAATTLARYLPRLLASAEDGRARRLIARLAPRLFGGASGGAIVARALRLLVAGGRHQEVFGFVLDQLRAGMAAQEDTLRGTVEDRVREQGGRLVGWAFGATVAKRVLHAVNAEFDKMEPENSDLRLAFDEWAQREIARIENDPEHAAAIGHAIRRVIGNDTVQTWLWDVWGRARAALERDAAAPTSRIAGLLQSALADLGRNLADDPATAARLHAAIASLAARTLPALRLRLVDFIGQTVAGWDTPTIVDRLELRVGRDLQYVRMNGTIVGALAGGCLFAALHAIFPHAGGW